MVCDEDEQGRNDWIEAGQRAVMLMTSSLHFTHAAGGWVIETKQLLTGLTPCELALTLMWVTRIGAESLAAGGETVALEALADIGLSLEKAGSDADLLPDVRD